MTTAKYIAVKLIPSLWDLSSVKIAAATEDNVWRKHSLCTYCQAHKLFQAPPSRTPIPIPFCAFEYPNRRGLDCGPYILMLAKREKLPKSNARF